jgi:hypothetical protein
MERPVRLMRAAAVAVTAGVALVAISGADARRLAPENGAPPPVSAADVVLYVFDEPCAEREQVAEITVSQETMRLADVLIALRLEAAHRGANAVMDIRVEPGEEGRFRVSGQAIRCKAQAPGTAPDAPAAAPRRPGRGE